MVWFILYNIVAFGLQPIIGYCCDNKPNIRIGIIGGSIVFISLLLIKMPYVSTVLCAIGNACFHVGGGIDSLVNANGKMSRSGIFVSSGALGVSLGTMYSQSSYNFIILPLILIGLSIVLMYLFTNKVYTFDTYNFNISSNLPVSFIVILGFISILIRSYTGTFIPMDWKIGVYVIVPSICACVGKALGGILGDMFGAKLVGVLSLIISIPFICLGNNISIISMIGIILFNMNMSITLCTISSVLKENPGLSFGITTLALLCGNILTCLVVPYKNMVYIALIISILISAICTYVSTTSKKGEKFYD